MLSKCCQKYNIYCETYGPEKQMTYILDIINMHENNNNNNNNNDFQNFFTFELKFLFLSFKLLK